MEALILVPKTKNQSKAIKAFANALNIPLREPRKKLTEKDFDLGRVPNKETIKAINDARAGKVTYWESVDALFNSI
ncbi:MAG: hypothetical protein PW786_14940 [Arachidicoccus sp.]|nr:hypothetical protein [Arachidicoccus sp.]